MSDPTDKMKCDSCGFSTVIDSCMICKAPRCCQFCCLKESLRQEREKNTQSFKEMGEENKRLREALKKIAEIKPEVFSGERVWTVCLPSVGFAERIAKEALEGNR